MLADHISGLCSSVYFRSLHTAAMWSSLSAPFSSLLHQKTDYFSKQTLDEIEIWPQHLDFYRHHFLECVSYIESKIQAKFKVKGG